MKVTIIGGGIAGLASAYYLRKQGMDVVVIERNRMEDGCSYGNMGYVSPSHFIPLATPGIVAQGLKWMLRSSSPFYIKPRLNWDLIQWGMLFWRNANAAQVQKSVPHLNNLLQLTRELVANDWKNELPQPFHLVEKGCWMLFKQEKTKHHEADLAEQAEKLGLKTRICSPAEVQELEPEIKTDVAGGVLYYDDCHVQPAKLMQSLYHYLQAQGVKFWLNTEVQDFEVKGKRIVAVRTDKGDLHSDSWVLANGSWLGILGKKLGTRLPMQPGKGYSLSFENMTRNLQHPAILVDHRTATTPIDRWLRIGGTMELSGHNDQVLPKRVQAIVDAVKLYFPDISLPAVDPSKAWFGYRPVTPDGMPYIGKLGTCENCFVAGGHAMLGISAAAGSGLLLGQIMTGQPTSIPVEAFKPERFR